MSLGSLLPPLGETIRCPCCDLTIPALMLTDAYLCLRHGLFEVGSKENSSKKNNVIHLDSGQRWQSWQGH